MLCIFEGTANDKALSLFCSGFIMVVFSGGTLSQIGAAFNSECMMWLKCESDPPWDVDILAGLCRSQMEATVQTCSGLSLSP